MKTIKEVMRTDVPPVSPEATLQEVTELMSKCLTSGLPVLDGCKIVGIITDGDILSSFYLSVSSFSYEEKMEGGPHGSNFQTRVSKFKNVKVRELMTAHPRCINQNAGVDEAASIIKRFKIKRLIVTNDKGELVGMVERLHIAKSILG